MLRVVFDTSVVVSAMAFPDGQLSWLRSHWMFGECLPLISAPTVNQLTEVLAKKKFRLKQSEINDLLAEYLPQAESIFDIRKCSVQCRDISDQMFLDLAHTGKADVLVSSDKDILVLAGKTKFEIEGPENYRARVNG